MKGANFIGLAFLITFLAIPHVPSNAGDACRIGNFIAETAVESCHVAKVAQNTFDTTGTGPAGAADATAESTSELGSDFACGPEHVCDPKNQYCSVVVGGPAGVPAGYDCIDVSNTSMPNTCSSVARNLIGCSCAETNGRVTVTCAAP